MSFLSALWAAPARLPPLAKYTAACGLLYLSLGLAVFVLAGPLVTLIAELEGYTVTDVGLVRALGMAVAFIGWFYLFGGRTGADSFALSTVVDRLLVPAFLVPLWWTGELPASLALPFAIFDPLLGLGALILWARGGGTAPAGDASPAR